MDNLGTLAQTQTTVVGYGTNGKNEIEWVENNQWTYGQYVLGLTTTSTYSGGTIFEADIGFNGLHHTWSTTNASNTMDVLSVAAHEQGHALGLQHVLSWPDPNDPPTMAPNVDLNGNSATINSNDEDGICFLYPDGYTCQTNDDCPFVVSDGPNGEYYSGQITCQGNLCGGFSNQVPEGDKLLGEECVSDFDCGEPNTFCQMVSNSGGICAITCDPNANNCPSPLVCMEFSNGGGGVCLPSNAGAGDKQVGEPCSGGQECETLLCVAAPGSNQGECMQSCYTDDPATCPPGWFCSPLTGANTGVCVEQAALKPSGESCSSPNECLSQLCVGTGDGYYCLDECNISSGNCPDGFSCLQLSGTSKGACFPAGGSGLGAECLSNIDCDSGICIEVSSPGFPSHPFCTQNCGECPCGFDCVSFVGGDSYCVPGVKLNCVPDGNSCIEDTECISGLCHLGLCADPKGELSCSSSSQCPTICYDGVCPSLCYQGFCEQPCVVITPICPPGTGCLRLTTNEINGVCRPPGPSQPGIACGSDTECNSLFCESAAGDPHACLIPCDPANGVNCGEALECLPVKAGVGGCFPIEEELPVDPPPINTEEGSEEGAEFSTEVGDETGSESVWPEPGDEGGNTGNPFANGETGNGLGNGNVPPAIGANDSDGGCQQNAGPAIPALPVFFLLVGLYIRVARMNRHNHPVEN